MRRFGRWMFNGLTVLSLLLCVATVALCVRSCSTTDTVGITTTWKSYFIMASRGDVLVGASTSYEANALAQRGFHWERESEPEPLARATAWMRGWGWGAFYLIDQQRGGPSTSTLRGAVFPLWVACITLSVLPLARWSRWRNNRIRRRGCCPRCRYNLTGNVSGVCPECGTVIPK